MSETLAKSEVIFGALAASQWLPTETKGLDYAVLRAHETGGATIFLRFARGTHGAQHTHPGGEELFVVSGDISIGGKRIKAGDYLYTPPDASHDALAHDDTVLLLNLPKLPVFI
jgi:quercetin dioxygenase-like cupin family protein